MGRINKQWSHVIGIGVEVSAPDQQEAARRIEDVRDALQSRFVGAEIYPPRSKGSPSRIPGSPVFKHFLMLAGRPDEVDPFDDAIASTSEKLASTEDYTPVERVKAEDRAPRIEQTAKELVALLRHSIDAGWIPAQGQINDVLSSLEAILYNPDPGISV